LTHGVAETQETVSQQSRISHRSTQAPLRRASGRCQRASEQARRRPRPGRRLPPLHHAPPSARVKPVTNPHLTLTSAGTCDVRIFSTAFTCRESKKTSWSVGSVASAGRSTAAPTTRLGDRPPRTRDCSRGLAPTRVAPPAGIPRAALCTRAVQRHPCSTSAQCGHESGSLFEAAKLLACCLVEGTVIIGSELLKSGVRLHSLENILAVLV